MPDGVADLPEAGEVVPVRDFPIEHGRLEGRNQRRKRAVSLRRGPQDQTSQTPLLILSTEDGTHPSAEEAALPAMGQAPGHPMGLTGTSA